MENVLDDEPPETMLSLSDYETPSLKLSAKSFDYFVTIRKLKYGYRLCGEPAPFHDIMDEIPLEVFALYLNQFGDEEDDAFIMDWLDFNARFIHDDDTDADAEDDAEDDDKHPKGPKFEYTSEFLQLTRFFFQPKVSVLSSAVRGGQLNLCTSKFILSYLFGDENSWWKPEKQLADINAYMDHMVFDFCKNPTACIKL